MRLEHTWDDRDAILYALSVGARVADDLDLLYENAPGGFRVAPTFALAPMAGLVMPMVAELGIELGSLLHAGQSLVVHREMPASGSCAVERRVVEVVDKGRAALVRCRDTVGDYATAESTWWIAEPGAAARLAGAVEAGGSATAAPRPGADGVAEGGSAAAAVPERAPDFVATFATTAEQAALHRLAGDRNPVHIDPALAASTGQARPFLHGLCTFGALGLALQRASGRRLASLDARFTRPVFPGDVITFEAWEDFAVARAAVDGETVLGPAAVSWSA